tara:strand:+ start:17464 stop:17871 length:408 start_codon:yes stop_codon:yes gene_type:complete
MSWSPTEIAVPDGEKIIRFKRHSENGDIDMTRVEKNSPDIMGTHPNPESLPPEALSEHDLANRFIEKLHEEGVDIESINEENAGLGDAIGNVLSKIGITSERIEKVFGIDGCGCDNRKQYLNKLFPFFKKHKDDG